MKSEAQSEYSRVMTNVMRLQKIGNLKNLYIHYKKNIGKMTTIELCAIYSRALMLDEWNRDGKLDEPIQKFRGFLEELVHKIGQKVDFLPPD